MRTQTIKLFTLLLFGLPNLLSAQYIINYPMQSNYDVQEISCIEADLNCDNGYIVWEDGRSYEGAILKGKPNGEGKMTWASDIHYEGSFKNGNRHGYGKLVNKKTIYDGEWRNDMIGDQGAAVFENGDEYLGAFMDGSIHGKGTMRYDNGALYSGDWKDGIPHGEGTLIRSDKSTYTGTSDNGMRQGNGMVTWASGDTLQGEWKSNRLTGKAIYFFNNGDKLISNWRAGRLSNRATYLFKNGKKFSGSLTQLKEETSMEIATILATETNFQLAWMGVAMEFKANGEYDLANDFLSSAKEYATTSDQHYDLIDKVMVEVEALQKERGLANLPKKKAE